MNYDKKRKITAQAADSFRTRCDEEIVDLSLTRLSHLPLTPDHSWLAVNPRSAVDVAMATSPSVQVFSL